jgi:hypothetical protein
MLRDRAAPVDLFGIAIDIHNRELYHEAIAWPCSEHLAA